MAWLAVDENGTEGIYNAKPIRHKLPGAWGTPTPAGIYDEDTWFVYIPLSCGSIEKLIGRKLTWQDKPVEI